MSKLWLEKSNFEPLKYRTILTHYYFSIWNDIDIDLEIFFYSQEMTNIHAEFWLYTYILSK